MSSARTWNGDRAAIAVVELSGGSIIPGASNASDLRR